MLDRRTFLFAPLALAAAADRTSNLLLITASGWRGQAAPWDGDPDLDAPNLEKFGKQSAVFSRTYSCCPSVDLAQTALLTSKFPHAAKVDDPALGGMKLVAPETAFEKVPFAIRMVLPNPGSMPVASPENFHPRGNVPSENERTARQDLAKFYASCRRKDALLGEILAAIDKLNLSGDTVVAFTSDCGQQIGSQGLDGAGVFFEESLRIPLAIRCPRKLKPEARDLASQIDIMPTLLTLCGMEVAEGVQGVDLFGKTQRDIIFAEGKLGESDEWRMLLRGFDKIVATPKGEIAQLYNLADDPYEMTNLAKDPAQKLRLASMKAQLLSQMKKLGDGMDPSGLRKR